MMAIDIATRVYNHAFRIDPAIRTLLDTDFYKLLMLQMIWKMHRGAAGDLPADQPDSLGAGSPRSLTSGNCIDQLDHAREPEARQERTDLARRQYLLRHAPYLRTRIHGVARGLPACPNTN